MDRLTDHPITKRWPPTRPDAIQLYSFPTPNGQKAAIALEELELPYEAHRVAIADDDQKTDAFLSLNPNGKIPAMIDPNGPSGRPLPLFESGAILSYLAEKAGRLGVEGDARWAVQSWLHWQIGGIGPFFGQVGFFIKFAGKEIDDPRPRERYLREASRLLRVLERGLEGRDWVAGDFSIADIAIGPWLRGMVEFYDAGDAVGWKDLPRAQSYLERFLARPAVRRGLNVPPRE